MSVTPVQLAIFNCFRWNVLPAMPAKKFSQSALFISHGDDDATVLVVGGCHGSGKEAAILSSRSGQPTRDQGNPWRWQKLSPMQRSRPHCPGMLLLGRDRALVAGGGNRSAEILHLPRGDKDKGVWTLLTQPVTQDFYTTFLANFNNRILAIGKSHTQLVTFDN